MAFSKFQRTSFIGFCALAVNITAPAMLFAEPVKPQIRLTKIVSDMPGSYCGLFLDAKLNNFVGGSAYEDFPNWTLGINGRAYALKEVSSRNKITLVSKIHSLRVEVVRIATIRSDESSDMPFSVDRVSVTVTMGKSISKQTAYRFCGEG